MKRLVGFDLNGWNDFGARNWEDVPGQETEQREQLVRGGVGGVVVEVEQSAHDGDLVGGIQALRSPHGRGRGWGKVGKAQRLDVRSMFEKAPRYVSELACSLSAMASARKATVVLAIPDLPAFDENVQEALLSCLGRLKPGRRLLVWRSVLAVIAALDEQAGGDWREGRKIGVIGHHAKGLSVQVLTLRREEDFAPERRRVGYLVECDFGLDSILEQARRCLTDRRENPRQTDHIDKSGLPCRLAIDGFCDPEPLRLWNARWEIVDPPTDFLPVVGEVPCELVKRLNGVDKLLFESPAGEKIRNFILVKLQHALGCEVQALEPQSVAKGALVAARRLSENRPVYYDFLPQISTIVQTLDGAANYDLIPRDALLPAGQSYRSQRPARLGLIAGTNEIKIHLKKETDPTPRRAVVRVAAPLAKNTPVELHLQQAPAAGRARLTLVSEAFNGPLVVDWERAQQLDQKWQAVIESLEPERPSVPNRLVLPCGTDNWFETDHSRGLIELLEDNRQRRIPDWKTLANKVATRPFGNYSVSSDGDFPADLPDTARGLMDDAIRRAEQDIRQRLEGQGSNDNQSLRFLTWLFKRCPQWIVPKLLDAIDASVGDHPFILGGGSRALMLQGIGRTAANTRHQRRAFDHLLSLAKDAWRKDQMACAAFLLSRNDNAPTLLERSEVEFIASVAELKIREAVGADFTTAYSYGPFLLVGLLRWRLKDPWALVTGKDPVADKLLDATQALARHLGRLKKREPRLEKHHTVLKQVCDELEGKGKNPDILVDLESFT